MFFENKVFFEKKTPQGVFFYYTPAPATGLGNGEFSRDF
jgi:hypothetical protein